MPKPTIIRRCSERIRIRRFRQRVDTIEASHQDARSFRSRRSCQADYLTAQSARCLNPDDYERCDNVRDKLEQPCASRSRQRESICEGTQISEIRRIFLSARSNSGIAVVTVSASRPHVASKQARNDLLNVTSRSMIKYCLSVRKPSSQLVSSRAIVFIHASFGLVVQPANLTRRVFSSMTKSR